MTDGLAMASHGLMRRRPFLPCCLAAAWMLNSCAFKRTMARAPTAALCGLLLVALLVVPSGSERSLQECLCCEPYPDVRFHLSTSTRQSIPARVVLTSTPMLPLVFQIKFTSTNCGLASCTVPWQCLPWFLPHPSINLAFTMASRERIPAIT